MSKEIWNKEVSMTAQEWRRLGKVVDFQEKQVKTGQVYLEFNNLGYDWKTTGYAKLKSTIIVHSSGSFSRTDEAFVEFSFEDSIADVSVTPKVLELLVESRIADDKLIALLEEAYGLSETSRSK